MLLSCKCLPMNPAGWFFHQTPHVLPLPSPTEPPRLCLEGLEVWHGSARLGLARVGFLLAPNRMITGQTGRSNLSIQPQMKLPAPCSTVPPARGVFEHFLGCTDTLEHLYPFSPSSNPRAVFPSSVIPVSSPEMELVLFRFSGMGTEGFFCSILGSLADFSSPGAALWPCGTALSPSQPCQDSSGIDPSLYSLVNGAEKGLYSPSIMEMGNSS